MSHKPQGSFTAFIFVHEDACVGELLYKIEAFQKKISLACINVIRMCIAHWTLLIACDLLNAGQQAEALRVEENSPSNKCN